MTRTSARPDQASTHLTIDFRDSIEWEELSGPGPAATPALRPIAMPKAIDQARATQHFNAAWNNTMPAHLVETPPPAPFSEPLAGMVMREMNEPDLFKHFFG